MTSYDLANGAAAAGAIVCAFGLPEHQRRGGVGLAVLLGASWLHFVLSYSSRPPVALLWNLGIYVASNDVWALLDGLLAFFAALCWAHDRRAWWAAAIYALALTQVVMHGLYWDLRLLPKPAYYGGLDKLFLAQVAVFILTAGGGIVAGIGRIFDRRGHVRRARASAYQAR